MHTQTVAAFTAPFPGLTYINGRFAGECGKETALILPVSPQNTLYCEFRPLDPRYLGCACALRLSGGELDPDSVNDGVYALKWPGSVIEIEFMPRSAYRPESEYANLDGIPVAMLRGEGAMLRVGAGALALPASAALPDRHISAACELFMGDSGEGRYLACFDRDDFTPLDTLIADRIEPEEDGALRAFSALDDIVGHMRVETWEIASDGLQLAAAEFAWADGAPKWPADGDAAARAACEAAILGLDSEAEAYLSPQLRGTGLLARMCKDAEACVALRYAPPSPRRAVGILRRENPRCGRIDALYFSVKPSGGLQGPWQIDSLSRD